MKGKISSRQIFFMIAISRISVIVVFLPVVTLTDVLQDAWISAGLATAAAMLLGGFVSLLVPRFPGRSFSGSARETLGNVLGALAGLCVGLLYYAAALVRTRTLSFLLVTSTLPEAPSPLLAALALLVSSYGAYLGPDAMGRTAELLFTLIIASILVGFIVLFISPGNPDLLLIEPVLSRGFGPVLEASLNPFFWFLLSAGTVLALGKYCIDPKAIPRHIAGAMLLAGAALVSITLAALVYLGPHQARDQFSPVLSLARVAFVPGVVERLDLVVTNMWVLGVVFDVTVLLLVSSVILGDALGVRIPAMTTFLTVLGIVTVSLRSTDPFFFRRVLDPKPITAIALAFTGLVGLVFLVSLIRGKGGKEDGRR